MISPCYGKSTFFSGESQWRIFSTMDSYHVASGVDDA